VLRSAFCYTLETQVDFPHPKEIENRHSPRRTDLREERKQNPVLSRPMVIMAYDKHEMTSDTSAKKEWPWYWDWLENAVLRN